MKHAILIKMALAKAGMSVSGLSRHLENTDFPMSKMTLGNKIKSDRFTTDELEAISMRLGVSTKRLLCSLMAQR